MQIDIRRPSHIFLQWLTDGLSGYKKKELYSQHASYNSSISPCPLIPPQKTISHLPSLHSPETVHHVSLHRLCTPRNCQQVASVCRKTSEIKLAIALTVEYCSMERGEPFCDIRPI